MCAIWFGLGQALFVLLQNIPFMIELIKGWNPDEELSAILASIAAAIAFALMLGILVLLFTHLSFLERNRTTIENRIIFEISRRRTQRSFRRRNIEDDPDEEEDRLMETEIFSYNLGKKQNFRQIFGDRPELWFLPIFSTKGDGFSYPVTRRPGFAPDTVYSPNSSDEEVNDTNKDNSSTEGVLLQDIVVKTDSSS